MSKRRRRWDRDFKLRAIARMDAAPSIQGLAEELGIRWEMLHKWRRAYEYRGADALHAIGRPSAWPAPAIEPPPSTRPLTDAQAALAALRHVRERRQPTGGPGETASTR